MQHLHVLTIQGIQYFSSVPVLHYLQSVLFFLNLNILHEYLVQYSLKLGCTNYYFKWVKVHRRCTAPYWKACDTKEKDMLGYYSWMRTWKVIPLGMMLHVVHMLEVIRKCPSSILIRIRTDRIFKRVGIDGRLGWGNMGERGD
jgi:hypothetical protein